MVFSSTQSQSEGLRFELMRAILGSFLMAFLWSGLGLDLMGARMCEGMIQMSN
jgi:hypothetical protein